MAGVQLVEGFGRDAGPFALLVGAGISLWHPSSLPTWREFNVTLLEEAKSLALDALPGETAAAKTISALTIDDVGSKAFSQALVEVLAGESYYGIIKALDSNLPNPAHRAIARLVKRRTVRAIVTTNFDTLIERALEEEGVRFRRFAGTVDYLAPRRPGCRLYKIHGTADEDRTVIDTVGQKLQGLPSFVRAELEELFAKYRVLVLGFGGGDLEFGADYLALRSVPVGKKRILWVVRPEDCELIDSRVRDLVAERGEFVAMQQAEMLQAIGSGHVGLEWNVSSRAAMLGQLQRQTRRLYAKLGRLNVLAFCMRLLSSSGKTGAAGIVWRHLDATIGTREDQTTRALGPVMRALAEEGHRLIGVEAQEKWACHLIRDIRGRRERGKKAPRSPARDVLVSHQRSVSGRAAEQDALYEGMACLALADAKIRQGQDEAVGIAMERAMRTCEYLGEIRLLPAVYRLYGWREALRLEYRVTPGKRLRDLDDWGVKKLIRHENTARGYLLAAEAAGLVAGNLDALNSALILANLLIKHGEYDGALACAERIENRLGLGLHREMQVKVEVMKGEIEIRQGRVEDAAARWDKCLASTARGNPLLEAHLKHMHVGFTGFDPRRRETALRYCRELLEQMAKGEVPSDGRSDLISAKGYYETVEPNLVGLGSKPLAPSFLERVDLEEDEGSDNFRRWPSYYLRQKLIVQEYMGDNVAVLDLLDRLVAWSMSEGDGLTTLDAALAHERRARLAGDEEQRFLAECNLAAVRHWLGDREWADAWYAKALRRRRPKDRQERRGLKLRLPHYGWFSKGPAQAAVRRGFELDLYDALELNSKRPRAGAALERSAEMAIKEGNFVLGRLLALQGIGAYRDESDPGGFQRCYELLQAAGGADVRSDLDVTVLCSEPN